MLTIAVVTKRPGLALTLNSRARHLVEVRPVSGWLDRSWDEQIIVLDLESATNSLGAVETLRGEGINAPLLVVAGDGPGWSDVGDLYPDVIILPLPISSSAVTSAIDRAAELTKSGAPASRFPSAMTSSRLAAALAEADSPKAAKAATARPEVADRPAGDIVVPPTQDPTPSDLPPQRQPSLPAQPQPRPQPQAETNPGAAVGAPHRAEAAGSKPVSADLMSVVQALGLHTGSLPRVPEGAATLCEQVRGATGAEAAAVLLPDPPVWRVAAGLGLRPLEHRLQIGADHWLVAEVVTSGHGLVIEGTDIARSRLSGAPLASWPNLLVTPIQGTSGLVVLAARATTFNRDQLGTVTRIVAGYARTLQDALVVRELARALLPFADPEG